MFSIGVYVTSRYRNYNDFCNLMDASIQKYIKNGKPDALVTGDFKSNMAGNGLVAKYAFERKIPLRKFATFWGKHIPKASGKRNNAGVASNAQIVKNSNGCILFWTKTGVAKWNHMSGGCYSFLKMCDANHLARPLVQNEVNIFKPDSKPVENTVETQQNNRIS